MVCHYLNLKTIRDIFILSKNVKHNCVQVVSGLEYFIFKNSRIVGECNKGRFQKLALTT